MKTLILWSAIAAMCMSAAIAAEAPSASTNPSNTPPAMDGPAPSADSQKYQPIPQCKVQYRHKTPKLPPSI